MTAPSEAQHQQNPTIGWERSLLDGLAEGLILIDSGACIVYANASAGAMLALPSAQLVGVPLATAFSALRSDDGRMLSSHAVSRYLEAASRDVDHTEPLSLSSPGVSRARLSVRATPLREGSPCGAVMALSLLEQQRPNPSMAAMSLVEQQSFLTRLIDRVPECMFLKDGTGRYVLVNQACARAYGTGVAAMLGRTESELADRQGRDEDETAPLVESDAQILSGAADRIEFDHLFSYPSGQTGWFHTSKALFTPQDGDRWVLGIAIDISDRVRIERELMDNRTFLRQAIDGSPGCIFIKDRGGRYLLVNEAMRKIFGGDTDSLVGKTDLEVAQRAGFDESEARSFMDNDRAVFQSGSQESFEERLTPPGEASRWFHTIKTPLDLLGQQGVLLGFAIDITERKRAAQALMESEARYRLLQESAPIGIALLDRAGRVMQANSAALTLLGSVMAEAVESASLLEHVSFQQAGLAEGIRRCLETRETIVSEGSYHQPGGAAMHLRYHLAPIAEDETGVAGVQAILEDVTPVRTLEAHLRQAAKLEAIGQLAGGVAHSFNNLLTVINGYTEMGMTSLKPDDPLFSDLEQIRASGQRAAELTQQLLTFSRRQPVAPETFDLNTAVEAIAEMLQRIMGEDVTMQLHLAPGPALIHADRNQIEQALMNLAVNARDAMPDGGTLAIRIEPVSLDETLHQAHLPPDPGSYIRLSVEDSGVGMTDDVVGHLFEPFFTTKEVGRGTGLGLAMVYGVVRELSGGLAVTSLAGHGTIFDIYLPAAHTDQPRLAEPKTQPYTRGGGETILVVEDQVEVRQFVVRLLQRLGYRVLSSGSAREAIGLCHTFAEPIDLMLVDVVMPDMTGPELVTQLTGPCGEAKVLFMSGYADDVIREKAQLSADLPLLAKPFTVESLAQGVRRALDGGLSSPG